MADLIERSRTIDALKDMYQAAEKWKQESNTNITIKARAELCMATIVEMKLRIENLPSTQPEPLTDSEQRIFLAAMAREEKICKETDKEYRREPYEVSLVWVCKEIVRKVKGALWQT